MTILSQAPVTHPAEPPRRPDVRRVDSRVVLVGQWEVGAPARQRIAIEEAAAAWRRVAWPQGLLSITWFASLDGEAVFIYSQWTSEEAADVFARTDGPTLMRSLPDAVPGLEIRPPVRYRLYRSGVRENAPPPGCLVVVSVEFDGADAARQRQWVDLVFDALGAETSPRPGGISGHFHISVDGTRVLNYAEWTSADAHRDALERSGQGTVGAGPKWRDVQSFPGLVSSSVKRYALVRSMQAPRVEASASADSEQRRG